MMGRSPSRSLIVALAGAGAMACGSGEGSPATGPAPAPRGAPPPATPPSPRPAPPPAPVPVAPDSPLARTHAADVAVEKAMAALERNDHVAAADRLEGALALDPRHQMALSLAADVASRRGDQRRCSEYYGRLVELRPDHPPTLISFAQLLLTPNRQPDYERAAAALERAREIEPGNPAVHLLRGTCLYQWGRPEPAIEALETSRRLDPRNPVASYYLGLAHSLQGRPAEAEKHLRAALDGVAVEPTWRWTLSLELLAQGKDPAAEPPRYRFVEIPESRGDPGARFVDEAPGAGLARPVAARGSALFDYDGDGRVDVLVNSSYFPPALYRNEGGWRFREVSREAGLADLGPAWGCVAADFDNDGDEDVFLTRNGWFGADPNSLLRNDGDGRFTDVAAAAGVADPGNAAFAAAAADVDGDGLLDLYVANLFPLGRAPNRLYRNVGGLRFEEIAAAAGVADPGPSIGCCFGDYDGDGRPDLYVSDFGARNSLFRNEGGLRFRDVTLPAGTGGPQQAFVSFFLDFDADGDLDLFCAGFSTFHDFAVSAEEGRPAGRTSSNALYRNDGGVFRDVAVEAGMRRSYGTMAANFADADGDGSLDVFLGNGGPDSGRREPNAAYFGDGAGGFVEAAGPAGMRHVGRTHGISAADMDGDGLEELLVPTGGAYRSDIEAPRLYRFLGKPLPSVALRLRGVRSNRDAVGARVVVERGGRRQLLQVAAGVGFGCTNGKDLLFHPPGKGPIAVEVRWPSGRKIRFEDVPPGRWMLAEDAESPVPLPPPGGD